LEHENGRLKKLVAKRDLEIEVMKETTRKTGRRADPAAAVAYARTRGLSLRRACELLQVARSTQQYTSVRVHDRL
jgi:hypothetical protein